MQECTVKDKKILMFGPNFFGYREAIAEQLRLMGAVVDLYDERPNNGVFCKTMLRYRVPFYRPVVRKYYRTIVEENKDKQYDFVFVIKSEAIDRNIFEMMKQAFPKAKFVLYLWDSVQNVPNGEEKIRWYDRVLTFDPVDAKTYGLLHRPLFFRKEYEQACPTESYEYDVAFVGTAHSIRPRVVKQIFSQCQQRGGRCFGYLFLPHPLVYVYNKICNPDYRDVKKSDLHFTPISAARILEVYNKSRSILDVEHSAQRGLTIRTIEMVGMQKKILTTNQLIKEYDFYHPNNICVISKESPEVREEFLSAPYVPIASDVWDRYTLRAFVSDILDGKE